MIRLSSIQVKALNEHTSKDKTKLHLAGWFFDIGAKQEDDHYIVATDGHRLIQLPIKIEADFEKIRNTLNQTIIQTPGIKPTKARGGFLLIEMKDKTATFSNVEKRELINIIDCQFPDYKQVIPKPEVLKERPVLRIDPTLFLDQPCSLRLPARYYSEPITVFYSPNYGYEDLKDAVMLVMPLRKNEKEEPADFPGNTAFRSAEEVSIII